MDGEEEEKQKTSEQKFSEFLNWDDGKRQRLIYA